MNLSFCNSLSTFQNLIAFASLIEMVVSRLVQSVQARPGIVEFTQMDLSVLSGPFFCQKLAAIRDSSVHFILLV